VSQLAVVVQSPGPHRPIRFQGQTVLTAGGEGGGRRSGQIAHRNGDVAILMGAVSQLTVTVGPPGRDSVIAVVAQAMKLAATHKVYVRDVVSVRINDRGHADGDVAVRVG